MWLGVPGADLDNVCPNRDEFPSYSVAFDLFTGVAEPSPTTSPSHSPTNEPTAMRAIKCINKTIKLIKVLLI